MMYGYWRATKANSNDDERTKQAKREAKAWMSNVQCTICVCVRCFFSIFICCFNASSVMCLQREGDITVLCTYGFLHQQQQHSISMSKNGQNSDKLDTCICEYVCARSLCFCFWFAMVAAAAFLLLGLGLFFRALFSVTVVSLLLWLANVDSFDSLK